MSTETTLHNFPLYFSEAMNSEKMFKFMLFGAKQWKFDEPKDNVIAIVYIYIGLSFVNCWLDNNFEIKRSVKINS